MTTFKELGETEFVSIESFRKNGVGVKSPVWITEENGKLQCWTGADSWKVKRIRNNPNVNLAICDRAGNIESDWVSATGQVSVAPQDVKQQQGRMAKKFGFMFRMFQLMGKVRGSQYAVIEFTPANHDMQEEANTPEVATV